MKNILIPETILTVSDNTAELIVKILDNMQIKSEIQEIVNPNTSITMYEIVARVDGRTANCLLKLIDCNVTMSLSEFLNTYSAEQFLSMRNAGQKSLKNLREILNELGVTCF